MPAREERHKALSSDYNMTIVCMNSQRMRSPAYGQASQRSGMNQGEAYETPHLGVELVAVGSC